ncbi:CpaF family protein [uncultured Amnibacterium sp.]|uniref:CpaF family protein n=1 Tax=uncultured Amnibacterium sp. TaxID=1631851 RepID=UPI0035CC005A
MPFVAVRPEGASAPPLQGPPEVLVPAPRIPALGVLAPFAEDPAVTDLLLDGDGRLWRDAGAGLETVDAIGRVDAADARRLAVALVAAGGRHLDDAVPCADVRLPGGARVHAVLPPVSTGGPLVSVRIARQRPWRLDALERAGAARPDQARALRALVAERRNVLVCGPAGSGKTSLLAALMAEVPPGERIVTVEDVAELVIDHPHVVGLEARQANSDGVGGIGLAALVRETLRMRPDRIVVGECRGAEIAELLGALNTGHDGGAGTVHCADPDALGARLEALGALAGLSPEALRAQALAAIHAVVQLGRRDGRRSVERIGLLTARDDGTLTVVDP